MPSTSPSDDQTDAHFKAIKIVERILQGEAESEIVELKHNNTDKEAIGQYISALSNSAALGGNNKAFMVWGIEDQTHNIVGTSFRPITAKGKGDENLVNWLSRLLKPHVHFEFQNLTMQEKNVVLLQMDRAYRTPVAFSGQRYIRIGSHKKNLQDYPDVEARLFAALNAERFEDLPAKSHLSDIEVTELLAYPEFFSLTRTPPPDGRRAILETLEAQGIINYTVESGWSITNLGAVLLAKNLNDFPTVARKSLRVIRYVGNDKVQTRLEYPMKSGYAVGFETFIDYIMGQLPHREEIVGALRKEIGYPRLAIRELVANALIHQDFSITGAGPMVEVFDDRVEISNPGVSLVPPDRVVTDLPRSRNEKLAGVMKLLNICEERGTGWDKVAAEVALNQLPAPIMEIHQNGTQVIVFGPRPLSQMDKAERIRAVYLQTCLQYATHKPMTNATVRARFKLDASKNTTASKLIKETIAAGLIVAYDSDAGTKAMRYVPAWARTSKRAL